jgi:hypothetical protein
MSCPRAGNLRYMLSRIQATEVPAKHAKDAKAAGLTPALKLGAIVTKR